MSRALIYLPQTGLRLFSMSIQELFIVPAARPTEADLYADSKRIDFLCSVAEVAGIDKVQIIPNLHACFEILETDLVDLQILNHKSYYENFKWPKQVRVIDYVTSGERNVNFSDLRFLNGVLRALKRNFMLSRKQKISEIVHWDNLAGRETVYLTPWSNYFVDDQVMQLNIRNFVNRFFQEVELPHPLWIILPPVSQDYDDLFLLEYIGKLLEQCSLKQLPKPIEIWIKPHRTSNYSVDFDAHINGIYVRHISSEFGPWTPVELIIENYSPDLVILSDSTSLFNFLHIPVATFQLSDTFKSSFNLQFQRLLRMKLSTRIIE